MVPSEPTLLALAEALHIEPEELREPLSSPEVATSAPKPLDAVRSRLLQTVIDLPAADVWDRPSQGVNGDLAFAQALGGQLYIVLIDGAGSGPAAAMSSVILASYILGILHASRGVSWPAEILALTERLPEPLGGPGQGAVLVVLFDTVQRSLHHARSSGMPAPFLRDAHAATSALQGRDSRLGRFREGEVRDVAPGALLLLATDGVANAARATGRPLWQSPDLRTWVTRSRSAHELTAHVADRATRGRPLGSEDDMLVVAMEL